MHAASSRIVAGVTTLLLVLHTAPAFVTPGQLPIPQAVSRGAVRRPTRQHDRRAAFPNIKSNGHPGRRRRSLRMHATGTFEEDSYATLAGLEVEETSGVGLQLAGKAIDALFRFEPFFDLSVRMAREKIVKRASLVGVNWAGAVDRMRRNMDELEAEYDRLLDREISTPSYYLAPFHCYPDGNLSWDAALEVDPSAVCVHGNIYTGNKKVYEPDGDEKLRSNYHQRMREMLKGSEPKNILDIGCSTGLSTLKLAQTFPSARITGVDLSPHMLAVGRFKLRTREDQRDARGRVEYLHAAGEMTGLADASMDLVSLSLTSHELPVDATRQVFQEAYRVLRPGGFISFMDMNPLTPMFQELLANPMAFAGFKSSEPYLMEYFTLDLRRELLAAGFRDPEVRSNSNRHRTCVAQK